LDFPADGGERQAGASTLIVELATGCGASGLYGKNPNIVLRPTPGKKIDIQVFSYIYFNIQQVTIKLMNKRGDHHGTTS
jgi:hypothetical protein